MRSGGAFQSLEGFSVGIVGCGRMVSRKVAVPCAPCGELLPPDRPPWFSHHGLKS